MKTISKIFWTLIVLGVMYWGVNKYGYITEKGSVNIDHKAIDKDWNKACDEADKDITEWAWKFGKKFDLFVDE